LFLPNLAGDLTGDGRLDAADVDLLCQQVQSDPPEWSMDLNGDQVIDLLDHQVLVEQLLQTAAGDANLDRVFNSTDLVEVFQAGKYEHEVPRSAGWATGDWNCDLKFDSGDLVAAFQAGRYAAAARAQGVRR